MIDKFKLLKAHARLVKHDIQDTTGVVRAFGERRGTQTHLAPHQLNLLVNIELHLCHLLHPQLYKLLEGSSADLVWIE